MLEYATMNSIKAGVFQYYSNTSIFFRDNNHIMKILVKRYYRDINIIMILIQKLLDFIV